MATPSKQGGCLCGKIRIEYEGDSSPVVCFVPPPYLPKGGIGQFNLWLSLTQR